MKRSQRIYIFQAEPLFPAHFKALTKLDAFARRVHDLAGWHSELYIDSRELPAISSIIEN